MKSISRITASNWWRAT